MLSNFANGISSLFGFTWPIPSFMEARRARNSDSRPGRIGARTVKLDCGVMLLEDFVSGRLVVRHGVHRMPQLRKHQIHPAPRAALIAQRAMLGDRMPRI